MLTPLPTVLVTLKLETPVFFSKHRKNMSLFNVPLLSLPIQFQKKNHLISIKHISMQVFLFLVMPNNIHLRCHFLSFVRFRCNEWKLPLSLPLLAKRKRLKRYHKTLKTVRTGTVQALAFHLSIHLVGQAPKRAPDNAFSYGTDQLYRSLIKESVSYRTQATAKQKWLAYFLAHLQRKWWLWWKWGKVSP